MEYYYYQNKVINIKDIENYLYNKSNIPMKISIKPFECQFKKFGESNIDIKILSIKINVILIKKSYITTILKIQ